jgi:hypothetical protein
MSENQELLRLLPNSPQNPSRIRRDVAESVSRSDQVLRHPEGRTASSTDKSEDDEWSDENIKRWLERDALDPELDEWVRATLGE